MVCSFNARGFPGGPAGKEWQEMQETLVPFLGWEGALEKGTATHFSIRAWKKFMDCMVHGVCKESDTTEQLSLSF